MGLGCTPEQLAKVRSMIFEAVGDWIILALPDGRFADFEAYKQMWST